ncbi:pectin lyase [Rhizoctonia solani AG-3 Rhs1AP]|uniref:pectin lyase n=1 Tax=Rhizoctonia solani AG-3 Rhs1AP TaxID=1086054 RepID=X8JMU0_9AGAM|nr:pectin lyase [Rhizoctonia solani AG-3 Rhs1AP]
MSTISYSLVAALFLLKGALAINTPFGYGAGTTGGGSATAAVPRSREELVSWLGDDTARVILLDDVYDFTRTEGSESGKGCKPWTCSGSDSGQVQVAIDFNGWCEEHEPNAEKISVTYDKAGTTSILVGSNKTLLGKGTAGAIKGKGLRIANARNVIIRNIRISDINPEYVWGGDGLIIESAEHIWIDHNYFKDIGRQFLVTVHTAESITISNNIFDGASAYSPTCNGYHYWNVLFSGSPDSITFAKNYLTKTSGRGPRLDGSGKFQLVHIFNNYFHDISGHALDAGGQSKVLLEGNYFNNVTEPATPDSNGSVFAPTDDTTAAECESYIGRKCIPSSLESSGALDYQNIKGVSIFKNMGAVTEAEVMDASQVKGYVLKYAGIGKVDVK